MRFFLVFLFVTGILLSNDVLFSQNGPEAVKLESSKQIEHLHCYNEFEDLNIQYLVIKDGFIRRCFNEIQYFDSNLKLRWTVKVGNQTSATNDDSYRLTYDGEYLYAVHYHKYIDQSNITLHFLKVNLENGEMNEKSFQPQSAVEFIDDVILRNDKLFVFGRSKYKITSRQQKLENSIMVFSKELENVSENNDIFNNAGLQTKAQWRFGESGPDYFTYISYYGLNGEDIKLVPSKKFVNHQETVTFNYDLEMVNSTKKKSARFYLFQNPLKFDTAKYNVRTKWGTVGTLTKHPFAPMNSSTAAYPEFHQFLNFPPYLYSLSLTDKDENKTMRFMQKFKEIVKPSPKKLFSFEDVINDPISNSITVFFSPALGEGKMYGVTLDNKLQIVHIYSFSLKGFSKMHYFDYSLTLPISKAKKKWRGDGTISELNAIDYIFSNVEEKVCTIINYEDSQILFLDDANGTECVRFKSK